VPCSLQVYSLDVKSQDLKPLWSISSLDAGAAFIVPLPSPLCGCVVLAEGGAKWYNDGAESAMAPSDRTPFTCWGRIGGFSGDGDARFLACSCSGAISLVDVVATDGAAGGDGGVELTLELVGNGTHASTATYLDNGFVFLGSKYANSQLIRITLDDKGEPVLQAR
jgi:DNA damage-binding protein 1